MKAHLRILSITLSTLLVVTLGVLWIGRVSAAPPAADFAPTYAPQEAAVRVAGAQTAREQWRQHRLPELANPSQLPYVPTVFFPQTGHHISDRTGFLHFWRANGQLNVFGYPITEEIIENDRIVQYFERARFEYHPELAGTPWQVQLGRLGMEMMDNRPDLHGYLPGFAADPVNGSRYFPETGHTLVGAFRSYWEIFGGVEVFGYPITEQHYDNGLLVQYFERARFEHQPGMVNTPYSVVVSDFGRQVAQLRGVNTAAVGQLANTPVWSYDLWGLSIDVNLSTQWLTAYEGDIPVYYAPVATGRPGFETPVGSYAIYDKLVSQDMRGSAGGETWYVPGVPWVMYVVGGVALHGTYWHNTFGVSWHRPSHGCINLTIPDAQWLYQWSHIGTPVYIHY